MLDAALHIGQLSRRQPGIVKRLNKYSFLEIAKILSGLLTQPETHAATLRIEGLIHLAALHCKGRQVPNLANVREWLNDILLGDFLGSGEDPPEDVFVTIAPSWTGPARLFEGKWTENSYHLQTMLAALLRFPRDGWVQSALVHVMPLLRLSEEIASRSGVGRYTLATSEPQAPVRVAPNNVQRGQACVSFTDDDLAKLNIDERALFPFAFTSGRADSLASEELGNTTLERLPLMRHSAGWLVVLPTALSAAARRFILDLAQRDGQLEQLGAHIRDVELQEVMTVGISGWELRNPSKIRHYSGGVSAFTAEFDVGGYALVVYLTGDLKAVFVSGLQGVDSPQAAFEKVVFPLQQELAGRGDYRRGLTIILLGGVGRGLALGLLRPPPEWQQLEMSMADALRLGWDHDFTAVRAWKLRTHEHLMAARGYQIINVNGFLNHYGFLQSQGFLPVPPELGSPGLMSLTPNHVTAVRSRIRKALDYHLLADPTRSRWIEVQRRSTASFFQEISDLPLYVAPMEFFGGSLLAAVETEARTWWIGAPRDTQDPIARDLVGKVWDAAQRWMVRLAPELERDLNTLPAGPIGIELEFPEVELVVSQMSAEYGTPARPDVQVDDHGSVRVASSVKALRAYQDPVNVAERWLIAAMALGAAKLAKADRTEAWADALATLITRSDDARFVHAIPAATQTQALQFYAPLPPVRMVKDEDASWAMFGLAAVSGCPGPASLSPANAGPLLRTTVLRLWERIRATLEQLDRKSVVVRALLNQEAIDKDRVEWRHTAAALLALHDQADVVETHNDREYERGVAGIASRAIAEMAICTSPVTGGLPIADVDFDQLLGEVSAMVESASQCDAYFYGLTSEPLKVAANDSFQFDRQFLERIQRPFNDAQGERLFRDAAADYAEAFAKSAANPDAIAPPAIDPLLVAAMQDEFGLGFEDLFIICQEFAAEALEAVQPYLSLRRSEVLRRLVEGERNGRVDAERAYRALTLLPRAKWDEDKPVRARARDWQPWRMNRKLSLTRRPLIQIDGGEDPEVLVFPVLMDRVVRRVLDLVDGRLPAEMFDTAAIDQWIGTVVNDRGHAFNHRVAEVLQSIGFEAAPDQMMTRFGADRSFGDADVLAWKAATVEVWVIECKRLQIDRTVAEIGERFSDYTVTGKKNGKRTAIQKHLDRVEYLKNNPALLARHTGIESARLVVRSALVTDRIVPMQFTERMTTLVDRVSDFRNLLIDFA